MANQRIDLRLEDEIDALLRKLYQVSNNAKKESRVAFRKAAPILISAIQSRARESEKAHYRYNTPKISNKLRAPNGMGRIVATYMPGNLKRSFKALIFRRSSAVFVGPKVDKQGSGGVFSGSRVDGFYAHWMEYGAPEAGIAPKPFVLPAVEQVGGRVLQIAIAELKKLMFK